MLHPSMKSFDLASAGLALPVYQLNRDVDKDGKVDIALMSTFSGGVAGAGGYEVEFQDSAGQTHSDGAVWSSIDQTLIDIRTKVTVSKSGVAVTSKGGADLGDMVGREICARADALGPASVLTGLQSYVDDLARRVGVIDAETGLHVLVTGMLPVSGGAHRYFRSYDEREQDAYTVLDPGASVYWSGARFKAEDIAKFGLQRRPGEADPDFIRRFGVGILDVMRFRQGRSREDGPRDIWCVGGKIDCTTIIARADIRETFEHWQDVIGEKIDPFRGMSRGERRRIERLVA
jgi:hypothetical protein